MLLEHMESGRSHRAVVKALHLIEMAIVVTYETEHTPEIRLFLIAPKEFQFAVAGYDNHRRCVSTEIGNRGKAVDGRTERSNALKFSYIIMRHALTGEWYQPTNLVGIDTMFRQTTLVEAYHHRQITAGGMTGNENLAARAAIFLDVAEGPSHGSRRIVDTLIGSAFGEQSVVDSHNDKTAVAQLGGDVLAATLETAAMEPHDDRAIGTAGRIIDIEFAALDGIRSGVAAVRNVGDCGVIVSAAIERERNLECQKEQ